MIAYLYILRVESRSSLQRYHKLRITQAERQVGANLKSARTVLVIAARIFLGNLTILYRVERSKGKGNVECIFALENILISNQLPLKYCLQCWFDEKSSLTKIMTWPQTVYMNDGEDRDCHCVTQKHINPLYWTIRIDYLSYEFLLNK